MLRFANNAIRLLTYPPGAAALEPTGKDAGPTTSPLLDDDAFVLPALGDEPLVLPGLDEAKGADLPMVLPVLEAPFDGLEGTSPSPATGWRRWARPAA